MLKLPTQRVTQYIEYLLKTRKTYMQHTMLKLPTQRVTQYIEYLLKTRKTYMQQSYEQCENN